MRKIVRDSMVAAAAAAAIAAATGAAAAAGGDDSEPQLTGDALSRAGVMAAVIAICCGVMFTWYQRRD